MKTMNKKIAVIVALIFAAVLLFQGCNPPEIESTKLFLQKKQYDQAEEQAKAAIEKYPENPLAHFYYAKVLYEKRDYKTMAEEFQKAKELGLSPNLQKEADNYLKSGFARAYNAAVKYIKKAQSIEDSVQQLEAYKKAYEEAKNSYYCDPTFFATYNILIQLAINLNKKDEAKKFMLSAEKHFSQNDTVLYYVGKGYLQLGDKEKAFELFKKAEKINPANLDVIKVIIDFYLDKGDYATAESYLKRLVEKQPDDPNIVYTVAAVFYKEKKFPEASIYFEKLVQLVPDNQDYWVFFTNSLLQANQIEKAVKACKEAIENFPENADLWQQYAIALLKSGDVKAATEADKKAKSLREQNQ